MTHHIKLAHSKPVIDEVDNLARGGYSKRVI